MALVKAAHVVKHHLGAPHAGAPARAPQRFHGLGRRHVAMGMLGVGLALVASSCGVGAVGKGVQVRAKDLIYVFNKGSNSISVIDPATSSVKVVQTIPFSAYGLYPSNQYGLNSGYLMVPSATKVTLLRDSNLKPAATLSMPAAKGLWTAMLPSGQTGLAVARATGQISWIDMNPASREFGVVTKNVSVPGKVGLCDISLSPTGTYAYIPDLYKSKLQVVNTQTGATAYLGPSPLKKSFMGTVSWNGKIWAVESSAGHGGVEYMSLANPTRPTLIKTLTPANGLGLGAHTDEFSPNSQYDFVLDRTSSQVSVVSMKTFQVVHTINLPLHGLPRVGAFSYNGNTLFVSLEGVNAVAAINTHTYATKIIKVGTDPVGLAPTSYHWVHGG